jgi:hypothetical protein
MHDGRKDQGKNFSVVHEICHSSMHCLVYQPTAVSRARRHVALLHPDHPTRRTPI